MVRCPLCEGRKVVETFAFNGDKCSLVELPCEVCDGTGSVDGETLARLGEGRVFHHERMGRRESIGDCARRLGIRPSDVTSFEVYGKPFPLATAAAEV